MSRFVATGVVIVCSAARTQGHSALGKGRCSAPGVAFMKKWVLAAAAAVGLAGSANAAIVTLQGVTSSAPNDNRFTYQATLGGDEGLRSGDRIVIFDFAGYIGGSIFTPNANFVGSTELVSSDPVTPTFDDDASLTNLVFTYVGADFRFPGGPLAPFNIDGLGARSIFSATTVDAFFSQTVKNNPVGRPGGAGTPVFSLGQTTTPSGVTAIPEPATWAMMLGGFGLLGGAMRRRHRQVTVTA